MELKPCPFCGSPVNLVDGIRLFGWHKDDCFFQFLEEREIDVAQEKLDEAFILAWNRRKEPDNVHP